MEEDSPLLDSKDRKKEGGGGWFAPEVLSRIMNDVVGLRRYA
jgi:hypothetical protein